jgi:hypothetical protein
VKTINEENVARKRFGVKTRRAAACRAEEMWRKRLKSRKLYLSMKLSAAEEETVMSARG